MLYFFHHVYLLANSFSLGGNKLCSLWIVPGWVALKLNLLYYYVDLLFRIEEGTYGVVYRAREKATNEIVALKRLKMEKEKEGFPITSLREVNTLLKVSWIEHFIVSLNLQWIQRAISPLEAQYSRKRRPGINMSSMQPN